MLYDQLKEETEAAIFDQKPAEFVVIDPNNADDFHRICLKMYASGFYNGMHE